MWLYYEKTIMTIRITHVRLHMVLFNFGMIYLFQIKYIWCSYCVYMFFVISFTKASNWIFLWNESVTFCSREKWIRSERGLHSCNYYLLEICPYHSQILLMIKIYLFHRKWGCALLCNQRQCSFGIVQHIRLIQALK